MATCTTYIIRHYNVIYLLPLYFILLIKCYDCITYFYYVYLYINTFLSYLLFIQGSKYTFNSII